MTKIKLGQRPKNFKKIVTFPLHDGSDGGIEMTFMYRTKAEFGELIDSHNALPAAALEPATSEQQSLEAALRDSTTANADYMLAIAEGWDIDEPFERATIEQLANELPGAIGAIFNAYRQAVVEGRLGN